MEFRAQSATTTEVFCHAEGCTWRQVFPSPMAMYVSHMHAHSVHERYMGTISAASRRAEDSFRKMVSEGETK